MFCSFYILPPTLLFFILLVKGKELQWFIYMLLCSKAPTTSLCVSFFLTPPPPLWSITPLQGKAQKRFIYIAVLRSRSLLVHSVRQYEKPLTVKLLGFPRTVLGSDKFYQTGKSRMKTGWSSPSWWERKMFPETHTDGDRDAGEGFRLLDFERGNYACV